MGHSPHVQRKGEGEKPCFAVASATPTAKAASVLHPSGAPHGWEAQWSRGAGALCFGQRMQPRPSVAKTQYDSAYTWTTSRRLANSTMVLDSSSRAPRAAGAERASDPYIAFQLAVSSELLEATSLDQVAPDILGSLCDLLEWQAASVWLIDRQHLRSRAFWAEPSVDAQALRELTTSLTLGHGEGLPGLVWESRSPQWIAGFDVDASMPRHAAASAAGIKSAFAVPIQAGEFYGVLECFSRDEERPGRAGLRTIEQVGKQIGGFVRRVRKEADAGHLAAIIDSTDDAIVSKDLQGNIRSWNAGAERMFGYSASEMIGQSIRLIIPPDRQQEEDQVLGKVQRGEYVKHFETVRRRKDGSDIPISLTVSPIRDTAGRIIGASKIARDITDQKRAEEAVSRSEERQRALIAAIPTKLALIGPRWQSYYWNDDWLDFLGCSRDEMAVAGLTPFIHPDDLDRARSVLERMPAAGDDPLLIDIRYRRADGSYRWHLSCTTAFLGSEGEEGWISIAVDIQAIKDAEEVLQKSIEAKDDFLGLVAHELRTPLTIVVGNAEALVRELLRAEGATVPQPLEEIRRESHRLNRLVENMLQISQLERGVKMETEPQLVQRLLTKSADDFRRAYPFVLLQVDVEDGLPPVELEPVSLHQIVWNLLTNAAKYGAPGGPVILRAFAHGDEVLVTVTDCGAGVPPDEVERVFEPYYRSNRNSNVAAGLGLGLSVCRRMIEAQAGRMWAHARAGEQGMEFGFALPALPTADEEI